MSPCLSRNRPYLVTVIIALLYLFPSNECCVINYDQNYTVPCLDQQVTVEITPEYGPQAGGTLVVIEVLNHQRIISSNITAVQFGDLNCQISLLNSSHLSCRTAPADSQGQYNLSIIFSNETSIQVIDAYTYLPNPFVKSVTPDRSILSGGLHLTVVGKYFTSISNPKLKVTRIDRGDVYSKDTDCEARTDELLLCETPSMLDYFYHGLLAYCYPGRKKRSTEIDKFSRQRRNVEGPMFNDPFTQFYAGLILDGVTNYTNFTESVSGFSQLYIFCDPHVDRFTDDHYVKYYNSERNGTIVIWGDHLNYAANKEDIKVTVGNTACNVTSLATNQLEFKPPSKMPTPDAADEGPNGEPRVLVKIGVITWKVGYLSYSPLNGISSWEVALGVVMGLIGFGLLLVLLMIVNSRYKRYRSKRHEQRLANYTPTSASNYYADGIYNQGNNTDLEDYLQPVLSPASPQRNSLSTYSSVSGSTAQRIATLQREQFRNATANSMHHSNQRARSRSHSATSTVTPPSTPGAVSTISGFTDLSDPGTPRTPSMQYNIAYSAASQEIQRFLSTIPFDILEEINEELRLAVKDCLLDSSRLEISTPIGKGFFGKVYKGTLKDEDGKNGKTVAVKTLQDKHSTVPDLTAFLEEVVIMRDFDHINVLSLLGLVIVDQSKPYVILPFMELGDLKSHVTKQANNLKDLQILNYVVQVAEGMAYLASLKFIHRDLASRNCMINNDLIIKIADFGLSRDIYKSEYYRVETKHRPLPVKWMAIESLTEGLFSTKSDVWSFGVTVWELLTRGHSPYPDIDSFKMKHYLQSGRRLTKPDGCSPKVFSLIQTCWQEKPEDRPTFAELLNDFKTVVKDYEDSSAYLEIISD